MSKKVSCPMPYWPDVRSEVGTLVVREDAMWDWKDYGVTDRTKQDDLRSQYLANLRSLLIEQFRRAEVDVKLTRERSSAKFLDHNGHDFGRPEEIDDLRELQDILSSARLLAWAQTWF